MLPKIGSVQQIINTPFKRKSDGRSIMAQFHAPRHTATGGVQDPFRLVRTGNKSILKPGDVLIGGSKKKYLIIRGGVEENYGADSGVFKAVELDHVARVYRAQKVLDSITKRTNDILVDLGAMDYAQTPLNQAEDMMRIQYDHYEILTDFPLLIGDSIDKLKIVQQCETRLGVTWARMRDA